MVVFVTDYAAMIRNAKAEAATLVNLAMDARQRCEESAIDATDTLQGFAANKAALIEAKNWQLMVNVYCGSVARLNGIIELSEMVLRERERGEK